MMPCSCHPRPSRYTPRSAPVPVTHPAHVLNFLHRTLGFAGCPTDSAWPAHLQAYGCVPVAGVTVPGSGTPALLVGVSMTDDACPFTMTDGANDGFVLVSAQECACAGVLLCACVCVCVGVCVLVRFSCRGCVEPLLSQPGMRELLLCRVVLCHTS